MIIENQEKVDRILEVMELSYINEQTKLCILQDEGFTLIEIFDVLFNEE